MTQDALDKETKRDQQWYEDHVPTRGLLLNLPQIKAAFRELEVICKREAETIVGKLVKSDDMSDEDFIKQNDFLRDDAFRITVSIIGFDGETAYGEDETIFDSKNLPQPIRTIFFTNSNSFRRNASNNLPPNRFSVWLHFDKPPLFDPNPLVSDPTPNQSGVEIRAEDVVFFRAVQTIAKDKLGSSKQWYSSIHEKFAYDVGALFLALPYALYWSTVWSDHLAPEGSRFSSFWIAFFVYGVAISMIAYRALFGYLKWAFPVNLLEENKDHALRHRLLLGGILTGLIGTIVRSGLSQVAGW